MLAPSGGVEAADSAGLSLDCSILNRLGSDPTEHKQMSEAYGKGRKALLRYLNDCRAHDTWLTDSVLSLLGKRGSTEACLPVSPTIYLSKAGPTLPNPSCLQPMNE